MWWTKGVFPLCLLRGAHIVQAVALRFGDLKTESTQASVVCLKQRKSMVKRLTKHDISLHYSILSCSVISDIEKIWNKSNTNQNFEKKTRWSKDSRVRPVRPWGQWTPGAQWYLAGIHHSLCSWTSRRGTAEAGCSCTHHTRNARNKYTFSCQNSSDSHRRSMCPKGNWNIWSLWTQIGCTLLVDL